MRILATLICFLLASSALAQNDDIFGDIPRTEAPIGRDFTVADFIESFEGEGGLAFGGAYMRGMINMHSIAQAEFNTTDAMFCAPQYLNPVCLSDLAVNWLRAKPDLAGAPMSLGVAIWLKDAFPCGRKMPSSAAEQCSY